MKNSDMQIYSVVPHFLTSDEPTDETNNVFALYAKDKTQRRTPPTDFYKIKGDDYNQHFMIFELKKL